MTAETTRRERRATVRLPAAALQDLAGGDDEVVRVRIDPPGARGDDACGLLQDLHQNGMCFRLPDGRLQEGDCLTLEVELGDFSFRSEAVVRWCQDGLYGVEFLDTRARNAALLAELYAERLLTFFGGDESADRFRP